MHVQEGATAAGLLADPGFCREWDVLYQSCPWATAFQSRSFATAWYGAYASVFEPLLVHAPDAGWGLAGLCTLARNRRPNRLVHAVRAPVGDVLSVVEVVFIDQAVQPSALTALVAAGRRHLSLVDCVSFEVMRARRIHCGFAFNLHFAEHGFDTVGD